MSVSIPNFVVYSALGAFAEYNLNSGRSSALKARIAALLPSITAASILFASHNSTAALAVLGATALTQGLSGHSNRTIRTIAHTAEFAILVAVRITTAATALFAAWALIITNPLGSVACSIVAAVLSDNLTRDLTAPLILQFSSTSYWQDFASLRRIF